MGGAETERIIKEAEMQVKKIAERIERENMKSWHKSGESNLTRGR